MFQSEYQPGFCFDTVAVDGKTRVAVNVCGHESVGKALTKSMDVAPVRYLDEYGVDNLILPISVGSPMKCEGGEYSFIIDVVVHPSLVGRCVKTHRLFEHYITRLTALAIDWILQECGMKLSARDCKLVQGTKYFGRSKTDVGKIVLEAAKTVEAELKRKEASKGEEVLGSLVDKLGVSADSKAGGCGRSPLVVEMPSSGGIRKGFLDNARLYSDKGSAECNQPPAAAPLPLPEGLRRRCQVIDARQIGCTSGKPSVTDSTPKLQDEQKSASNTAARPSPAWEVVSLKCDEVEVVVRLQPPPGITSMKLVNLEATPNTIEIDNMVVNLPKSIRVDDISAKFLKSSNNVVVKCPLA